MAAPASLDYLKQAGPPEKGTTPARPTRRTVWDLFADEKGGIPLEKADGKVTSYPRSGFTPKSLKFLDAPIPENVPVEQLKTFSEKVAERLPKWTAEYRYYKHAAKSEAARRKIAPTFEERLEEKEARYQAGVEKLHAAAPPIRFAAQFTSAFLQTERGLGMNVPTAPEPVGAAEKAGEFAGGVVGFVAQTIPVEAAISLIPFIGPPAAAYVGPGLVAAAGRGGTMKQRLAAGGAIAATAGASRWATGAISRVAGRQLTQETAAAVQKVRPASLAEDVFQENRALLGDAEARWFADRVVKTKLEPMLSRVATRAGRIRTAAGIIVPAVAFGAVNPGLQAALETSLGEKAEPPKLKEVLGTTASFMLLNALTGGRGFSRQTVKLAQRGMAEAPEMAAAGPAGRALPPGPGAAAPPPPLAIDPRQRGLARTIIGQGGLLADRRPNPYDGNRTAAEGAERRLAQYLSRASGEPAPTDEHVRAASARVRREIMGVRWLHESMRPPDENLRLPEEQAFSGRVSGQLTETLAGKPVDLDLGTGQPMRVVPLQVAFYPWDPQQVRIAVADANQDVVALRFKSIDDLRSRIRPVAPEGIPETRLAPAGPGGGPPGPARLGVVPLPGAPAAALPAKPAALPARPPYERLRELPTAEARLPEAAPEELTVRVKSGALRLTQSGVAEAVYEHHRRGIPLPGPAETAYERGLGEMEGILRRKDVSKIARSAGTVEEFIRRVRNKAANRARDLRKKLGRGQAAVQPQPAREAPTVPPIGKERALEGAPRGPGTSAVAPAPAPSGGPRAPIVAPEGGSRPPSPEPPVQPPTAPAQRPGPPAAPAAGPTPRPAPGGEAAAAEITHARQIAAAWRARAAEYRSTERTVEVGGEFRRAAEINARSAERKARKLEQVAAKLERGEVLHQVERDFLEAQKESRAAKDLRRKEKAAAVAAAPPVAPAAPAAGRYVIESTRTSDQKKAQALAEAMNAQHPALNAAPVEFRGGWAVQVDRVAGEAVQPTKPAALPAGTKPPAPPATSGAERPAGAPAGVEHPPLLQVALAEVLGAAPNRAEWGRVQRVGATDSQLGDMLRDAFADGGGGQLAAGPYEYRGGHFPAISMKHGSLSGDALVKKVREWLSIPPPAPVSAHGRVLPQVEMPGAEETFALANQPAQAVPAGTRETQTWMGKRVRVTDGSDRGAVGLVSKVAPHPTQGWNLPVLTLTTDAGNLVVPSNMAEIKVSAAEMEAAGQADMFGGAPMLGREGEVRVGAAREDLARQENAQATAIAELPQGRVHDVTVNTADLYTHPLFQKRATGQPFDREAALKQGGSPRAQQPQIREANIQAFLRAEGGYSPAKMALSPPILWYDKNAELGAGEPQGPYLLGGHHRAELADWKWGAGEPLFQRIAPASRDIGAKVYTGSLAEAEKLSLTINQESAPNTQTELAGIAYSMVQSGRTIQEIADELRVKPKEAQALVDFFHVDAGLRDLYFPDGSEDSRFGTRRFADILGAAVRARPKIFTEPVQRARIQKILDKKMNLGEFQESLADFRNLVDKIETGDLPGTPEAAAKLERLMEPIERVKRQVAVATEESAKQEKAVRATLEVKNPLPGYRELAQQQLEVAMKELESLRTLLQTVQSEGQKIAKAYVERGQEMGPALHDLEAKVRAILGEENPSDVGGTSLSAFGAGAIGRMLSRVIWRNQHRFEVMQARRTGKKARTVVLQDARTGKEIVRYQTDTKTDPVNFMWGDRLAANLRAGGHTTFPPALGRAANFQRANELRLEHSWAEMNTHEIWGHAGLEWAGHEQSRNRRLAYEAVFGRAKVPPEIEEVLRHRQAFKKRQLRWAEKLGRKYGVQVPREILGEEGGFGYASIIVGDMPVDDLTRMFTEFAPQYAGDDQRVSEARNNFFDKREGGAPELRDLILVDGIYDRALARWATYLPFLAKARQIIQSEEMQEAGAWRAQAIRDVIQGWYFGHKGELERRTDDYLRRATFSAYAGQIAVVPREVAEEWLHVPGTLASLTIKTDRGEQAITKFYYKPKGVKIGFTSPHAAKLIGTTDRGAEIWGTYRGYARNPDAPMKTRLLRAWELRLAQMRARFRPGAAPLDEKLLEEILANRQRSLAFERNPTKILVGRAQHHAIRAVLWGNLGNFIRNGLGAEGNIFTEYGPIAWLQGHGIYVGVKGYQALRVGLHGYADMLARVGLMTPEQARDYRKLMPLLAWEMMGKAIGAAPGEPASIRAVTQRLERGWSDLDTKVFDLLKPLGHVAFMEAQVRGLDAMAAVMLARRHGLKDAQLKALYEFSDAGRRHLWKDLVADIGTAGTPMSKAAEWQHLTQYSYDGLGRPLFMSSPFGRAFTTLMNYQWNYFWHQDVRPVEGIIRWATGIPRRALFGKRRDPSVDAFIHHAAAVFLRQAIWQGALVAASDITGLNFMAAGVSIWVGMLLLLDSLIHPHSEEAKRRWNQAQWGMVVRVGGLGADLLTQYGFLFGGKQGVLDLIRLQLPVPLVLARRLLEENPETFDRPGYRVVYTIAGQKSALYGLSDAERAKHHAGLMPQWEAARHRHPIGWAPAAEPKRGKRLMPSIPGLRGSVAPSLPSGI